MTATMNETVIRGVVEEVLRELGKSRVPPSAVRDQRSPNGKGMPVT
ncbi:MAG: hypothetical protein KF861_15560 [Planctomycetaceae bacterium]|nr:hypothetical protein [Planctomycetaceae bacterium]